MQLDLMVHEIPNHPDSYVGYSHFDEVDSSGGSILLTGTSTFVILLVLTDCWGRDNQHELVEASHHQP